MMREFVLALVASSVLGIKPVCRQALQNRANGSVYTSKMQVGPYSQNVRIDTGSFDVLVESTDCLMCNGATYTSRKSNTFKDHNGLPSKTTPIEAFGEWMQTQAPKNKDKPDYGQKQWGEAWVSFGRTAKARKDIQVLNYNAGTVAVISGTDNVLVEGCPNLEALNSGIQEVIHHSVPSLAMSNKTNTIMGFGPGPIDEAHKRMHHMLGIDRFTLCYPKDLRQEGSVIWNDMHPGFRSQVVQLDVVGKVSWGVGLDRLRLVSDSLQMNEVVGCQNGCAAILDSGTSLLSLDTESTKMIFKAWERINDCSQFHQLPSIHFMLGGVEHILPPETYVSVVIPCLSKGRGMCKWNPVKDDPSVQTKQIGFDALVEKPFANVLNLYKSLSNKDQKKLSLLQTSSKGTASALKCELLLEKDFDMGDTSSGPLMVLGTPFFRYYTTTFDVTGEKEVVKRLRNGETPEAIWPEGVDTAVLERKIYTRPAGTDCSEEEVESPRRTRGLQLFKTQGRKLHVMHEEELTEQRMAAHKRKIAIKESVARNGI